MIDIKKLLVKIVDYLNRLTPTFGSNTNGQWVKFPDGTMICWGSKDVTSSTSATSAYFKYYGTATATFPQTFYSGPTVVSNIQKAAHYWNTTVTSISTTGCTVYAAGNSNTTSTVDYIAVGRWKLGGV